METGISCWIFLTFLFILYNKTLMYRFPVRYVKSCPLTKIEWEAASVNFNCSRDATRLNRYHCVPNQQKSALVEFCYVRYSGRYEQETCTHLSDSGYLNSEACTTFSHGCPSTSYLGDETYKYPACLQINTINRCYIADNLCLKSNRTLMYRFPVKYVKSCPLNKTEWEAASVNFNCSRDATRLNRYHCVPNQQKSALVEFCYVRYSGRYEQETCNHLSDSGYLNSEACTTFSHGCPNKSYLGDEIYKYPACLQINTINRCYIADNLCLKSNRDRTTITATTDSQEIETSYSNNATEVYNQTTVNSTNIANLNVAVPVLLTYMTALLILIVFVIVYLYTRYRKDTHGHAKDSEMVSLLDIAEKDVEMVPSPERKNQSMLLYLFLFLDGFFISRTDLHEENNV